MGFISEILLVYDMTFLSMVLVFGCKIDNYFFIINSIMILILIYEYYTRNLVTYNIYKINNTIIIGTLHPNHHSTIYPEIIKMMDNTDRLYVESKPQSIFTTDIFNNKNFCNSIINSNELSDEDKIFKFLLSINTNFPKSYLPSWIFYKKDFIKELKRLDIIRDEIYDTIQINFLMTYIKLLFCIDRYYVFSFLSKDKQVFELDKNKEEGIKIHVECVDILNKDIISKSGIFYELSIYKRNLLAIAHVSKLDTILLNFVDNFFKIKNFELFINKRNNLWYPQIKDSIDNNYKSTVLFGDLHLEGIINKLKSEGYNVIKYNYKYKNFE
jgi:hypothetical protein